MKARREFQIIDGYRQSPSKPAQPRAALAQESSYDISESIACLLREQVEHGLTAALTASEQRLSTLLHDRRRIGRVLQDSVLHALYAIEVSFVHSREQAADQLHTLVQDIRRIVLSVESDIVQPFRLASELRFLVQTVERMGPLRIQVEVDSSAEEVLTGEEARELVTIAREALNNCVRHAQATRIEITFRHSGSRVCLSIRDNGLGFDVTQGLSKGVGFEHMQDRARRIGGHLDIESTVGRGTCITANGPQIKGVDIMGLVKDAKVSRNHSRLLEP